MPTKREEGKKDAPRTDLPPKREPYYEGYFGSDEEETAERERETPDEKEERSRSAAEDAAGGDREI